MDKRAEMARDFVAQNWPGASVSLLAADASSRRYFRATQADGETRIVMDAPPETGEDTRPFIHVAKALLHAGLSAPRIFSHDVTRGFLLIEDFGDALFSKAIQSDPASEPILYTRACDAIYALRDVPTDGLTEYAPDMMANFVAPMFDAYQMRNGTAPSQTARERINDLMLDALNRWTPDCTVMILRDFHADNLIWLPERTNEKSVGLLDFQDALIGHRAYDLASLIDDARRDVPDAIRDLSIQHFADIADIAPAVLKREVAVQGAQRNMRILGVFVSLAHTRSKPQYLDLLPRVWGHLMRNLAHPDLSDLRDAVTSTISPPNRGALLP